MSEKPPCILITGVAGFLASGIVKTLSRNHPSWRLVGLDLKWPKQDITEKLDSFLLVDLTSESQVDAAISRLGLELDLVIHAAALVPDQQLRYSTNERDWQHVKSINYQGTVHLIEAVRSVGCTSVLYTSSITPAIDDLQHSHFFLDEAVEIQYAPQLYYGRSKALTETYLRSLEGIQTCVLRLCPILGPDDLKVIEIMHSMIAKGETYIVVGDGNNLSDWIYIDNAIHAHVLAAENLLSGSSLLADQIIYVTNQEPVYFWDLLLFVWVQLDHVPAFRIYLPSFIALLAALLMQLVTSITNRPATLTTGSVKDATRTYFASNQESIDLLGYRPRVSLSEGIRRTCKAYREQRIERRAA